jgi:hypothetical protein
MKKVKLTWQLPDGKYQSMFAPYAVAIDCARVIAKRFTETVMLTSDRSISYVRPDGTGYADYWDNKSLTGIVRYDFDANTSICI